jgi:Tfp pilus assembly protein PilZ
LGGVFVRTELEATLYDDVRLELQDAQGEVFSVTGSVAWGGEKKTGRGLGIRFPGITDHPDDLRRLLAKLLHSLLPTTP